MIRLTIAALLTTALVASAATARADDKAPKNLKVLAKSTDKKVLGKAMKSITKGLGVKCVACHVKGEFDSDDNKAKVASRKFFETTVGQKDKAKRDAALKEVLTLLKLEKAKKEDKIWAGVDMLKLGKK